MLKHHPDKQMAAEGAVVKADEAVEGALDGDAVKEGTEEADVKDEGDEMFKAITEVCAARSSVGSQRSRHGCPPLYRP